MATRLVDSVMFKFVCRCPGRTACDLRRHSTHTPHLQSLSPKEFGRVLDDLTASNFLRRDGDGRYYPSL